MMTVTENGCEYQVTYLVRVRVAGRNFSSMRDRDFNTLDEAVSAAKAAGYDAVWTSDECRDLVDPVSGKSYLTRGVIRAVKTRIDCMQTGTLN